MLIKKNNLNDVGATLNDANSLYRSGKYRDALEIYEALGRNPLFEKILKANVMLCRQHLASLAKGGEADIGVLDAIPRKPQEIEGVRTGSTQPITVTLTTIRSRLPLLPKVIESLHQQQLKPETILLNISHDPYLLDIGIPEDEPILQQLSKMPLLKINWVPNTGPYRKFLWFMQQHFSRSLTEDKLFVTVDDDTIYPDYFLQRLYDTYLLHDCVVAFRGRLMSVSSDGIAPYNKWKLGKEDPTLFNLPTGKDGILYNTKFFTRDLLEITDAINIIPTADDLWLKWHSALNGIPAIVLNPEASTSDYKSFPVVSYEKSYRDVSLYAQHNSSSAHGKNDKGVFDLESYFGLRYGYNLMTLLNSTEVAIS